jgi:penicillin-binding protein 1C
MIYKVLSGIGLLVVVVLLWPIPDFPNHYSTVIYSKEGQLLGASIAEDGQWRFPAVDSIPEQLETCILTFEDQYFHYHPGINPLSVARAFYQNAKAGNIVSGASTITMQVARMRYRDSRTFLHKLNEMVASLKLELLNSKSEILQQYVSHAPYGGNTVGIRAATWKYFNRDLHQLSWAEYALLAVLPNQPSALFPGRKNEQLKKKRDQLLRKLFDEEYLDKFDYQLAVEEPLPENFFNVPDDNLQLLATMSKKYPYKSTALTIDRYWQAQTRSIAERYYPALLANGVENMAAMVIDLRNGHVLSYLGNAPDKDADSYMVDIIQRPRSSGSLLKPFLLAKAIDRGMITPSTLLPDIPTFFGGFTPKNFDDDYQGAIPARDALARSLNIPFVHLLRDYSYEQFQIDLQQAGLSTISADPERYGLSLVLGGAEVTLWDICQAYFNHYQVLTGHDPDSITLVPNSSKETSDQARNYPSKIATWHMFDAMTQLVRPGKERNWEKFESSQVVAWKTGTSFGFRDAWAVGTNGTVLAAVWTGNADGEGRAGLVGSTTSGPILLELLRLSDHDQNWLEILKPVEKQYQICTRSGFKASNLCPSEKLDLPPAADRLAICEYHREIRIDPGTGLQVNSSCLPVYQSEVDTIFNLPLAQAYYYQKKYRGYKPAPLWKEDCVSKDDSSIEILYPTENRQIFIPRDGSKVQKVILQANHGQEKSKLFWHLNDQYIGSTVSDHRMSISLGRGIYTLTISDIQGVSVSRNFEIISQ